MGILRDSFERALKIEHSVLRVLIPLICVLVAGVGIAIAVISIQDGSAEGVFAGAFIVFVGIFLWVRLRDILVRL